MNYAIKRPGDGRFWDDRLGYFVPRLTENCEFGTPDAVAFVWVILAERERVDIIRVHRGRAIS